MKRDYKLPKFILIIDYVQSAPFAVLSKVFTKVHPLST
ncbi:MAG: hypothetical protein ACQZ3M_08025 [cyanobacterium endosymbiont of Rhopalodia fuxianensis]